ncbi:MAG: hypothetical protein AVDCRST_MAG35-713, partial [uncultured Quadrisphaera sp.]
WSTAPRSQQERRAVEDPRGASGPPPDHPPASHRPPSRRPGLVGSGAGG